jgi:hypothetical protein
MPNHVKTDHDDDRKTKFTKAKARSSPNRMIHDCRCRSTCTNCFWVRLLSLLNRLNGVVG